jgi:hypothetical protein
MLILVDMGPVQILTKVRGTVPLIYGDNVAVSSLGERWADCHFSEALCPFNLRILILACKKGWTVPLT